MPFTIFFLDTNTALINAFAMCINACLLYLAENQQMLKVIIERGNQEK
jgi:hypothetical protein